ncbi:hypothetical protein EI555_001398 [Monodon monoceros]|uniref:Uncharacterized protein n=1 Tax=Monodon monoceros TaxID=40151 RepID=A0A4U1EEM6_MONMO|nr:hypothetical protein EI555_001398 [Monodon monoceros]
MSLAFSPALRRSTEASSGTAPSFSTRLPRQLCPK